MRKLGVSDLKPGDIVLAKTNQHARLDHFLLIRGPGDKGYVEAFFLKWADGHGAGDAYWHTGRPCSAVGADGFFRPTSEEMRELKALALIAGVLE